MPGYSVVQGGGNGTRKDFPAEVVGRDLGLHRPSKVKEGSRGVVEWIDVYDNVEVDGGIWVDPG